MRFLGGLLLVLLLALVPTLARACAVEDVNDNGIVDAPDLPVPDAAWLGGAAFVTGNPFLVPAGCDRVVAAGLAVTNGVRVTAAKIKFFGRLDYLPPGGRGVVLLATGSLQVGDGINPALIRAGGFNTLPANSVALYRRSVALFGGGPCVFRSAEIRGVSPLQNTSVGILCEGDLTFRSTAVVGSKVNIQSLTGKIDGSNSSVTDEFLSLAALCDAAGNNNGITDAPDFPCSLNLGGLLEFDSPEALAASCAPRSVTPGNVFHAFNDPLIMIAGAGANALEVQGASIVGRYRVTLAAEDGPINTNGAIIDHGQQLGLAPPGGARIWLFADPVSVVRLPVDHEDFFGPSAATTFVDGTCFRSPNPINVGRDAALAINLVGTLAPFPCQQLPGFVGVLNGIF